MAKFLANENVPGAAVEAARQAGVDVSWVQEISPGISDDAVLALSRAEDRVLVTFDKDFGEMAFEQGKTATPGVILLRPQLRSPEQVAQFTVALLPIHRLGGQLLRRPGRTPPCCAHAGLKRRPAPHERLRTIKAGDWRHALVLVVLLSRHDAQRRDELS